jgi:hypothetical protein
MNRPNQPVIDVHHRIEEWLASQRISYQDYHKLLAIVLSDNPMNETKRQQLNRLFDAVRSGQIKVVR